MAKIKNRRSVLALVTQVATGTPKAPTAAADYAALQEGFEFNPSFSELESQELQDSIGQAKTILGTESPTMSFSHYLKHSGVEGQEPEYGKVLHSLLGMKTVNAVEIACLVASTTEIIKVADASLFRDGQALLVKDPVNGYSIRNIKSRNLATDELTLGFLLPVAPGVGVNLGKAVHYEAASEGHPELSVWGFRGNGGAVELIGDAKCTDMSIDITAGELINAQFNFAGTSYFFNPIEITATSKYVDLNDGAVDYPIVLNEGFYKDPHELAESLQQKINDSAIGGAATVTYSDSTGKFTIALAGGTGTFEILWNTGANTANSAAAKLGFSTAADSTGALTYTGASAISLVAPQTPSYDASNPIVAKSNEILLGAKGEITCFGARSVNVSVQNEQERNPDLCSDSGFEGTENVSRSVTFQIVATISQYEAKKYSQFRKGDEIAFCYNLGEKLGGNWVAGKCVNMYAPYATITNFKIGDANGVATLEMSVRAFVKSGAPEFHVNCL